MWRPGIRPVVNRFVMSRPQPPNPAKLVIGFFMKDRSLLEAVAGELTARYGPIDFAGAWLPFDFTTYYEKEFGSPLFRRMLAFEILVGQEDLATIKLATNRLELAYCEHGLRRVNLDPGYLLAERFVLASGKNYSHRIYMGQGIYADLTLIYREGAYQSLPWTYPDYACEPMRRYLERVRTKYLSDLKKEDAAIKTETHIAMKPA